MRDEHTKRPIMTLHEVAAALGVSHMTIKRDDEELTNVKSDDPTEDPEPAPDPEPDPEPEPDDTEGLEPAPSSWGNADRPLQRGHGDDESPAPGVHPRAGLVVVLGEAVPPPRPGRKGAAVDSGPRWRP